MAWEIGVLLTTPPSTSRRSPIRTGKHARNRGGRRDGIERRPIAEQQLASFAQIEREDVKRDRCLGQVFEFEVSPDQPAQSTIGNQVIAPPAYATNERAHTDWEDVLALEITPYPSEFADRRGRLRPRGDERCVERPDRRSDKHVGGYPVLVERLQHPDLERSEAGATREYERCVRHFGASRPTSRLRLRHGLCRFCWRTPSVGCVARAW